MIRFEAVAKEYKTQYALSHISFSIAPGEFVCVVGPSGAGKSTVINLILGRELPSQGQVLIDGIDMSNMTPKYLQIYRRKVGTVFQDYKLLEKKTAYENVAFALEVCGEYDEVIAKRVPEVLQIVGLGDKQHNFPRELSGGEQQRVALARALIHEPKLLLADEPTGNLDEGHSVEILKLLMEINKTLGTTVILTTHDMRLVRMSKQRVLRLDRGALAEDTPATS